MEWGSWPCTGDRDQDYPHGKEMQIKMVIMIKYYYLNKCEYCTLEYFIKKLHMLNWLCS